MYADIWVALETCMGTQPSHTFLHAYTQNTQVLLLSLSLASSQPIDSKQEPSGRGQSPSQLASTTHPWSRPVCVCVGGGHFTFPQAVA